MALWQAPTQSGVITQNFAWNGTDGHTGTDYATAMDEPVHAVAAGTVVATRQAPYNSGNPEEGQFPGPEQRNDSGWEWLHDTYGSMVVVDHGDMVSLYGHTKPNVQVGATVGQGEVVGFTDNTGKTTGPHCHLERRAKAALGNPLRPEDYMQDLMADYSQGSRAIIERNVRQFADIIQQETAAVGMPASIAAGIISIESNGVATAESPMNSSKGQYLGRAQGLMQVLPSHFGVYVASNGEVSPDQKAYMCDVQRNIQTGCKLLAQNYAATGRWDHAAAAYFGDYDWSTHTIPGYVDATGANGSLYVQRFNAARSWFTDLDAVAAPPPPPPAQTYEQSLAEALKVQLSGQLGADAGEMQTQIDTLKAGASSRDYAASRNAAIELARLAAQAQARIDQFGG